MIRQFDHFHQQVVHRFGRDDQAGILDLRAIAVVEFVTVAMAFGDDVLAVDLARLGTGLDARFLQAEAHRAAQVGGFVAALDIAGGGTPLGDQGDDRVFAVAIVLGRVRTRQTGEMPRHVHHRRLHAVADAEVRDALLTRVTRGHHLALETAVAETAGHEDRIHVGEHGGGAFGLDLLRLQPLQPDLGALAQAAVAQGFGQRLVRVLVVDVLADDGHGDLVHRMFAGIHDRFPFGQVGRLCLVLEAKAIDHDLVELLRMQPKRQLVDVVDVNAADDGLLVHVGEQRDLAALAVGQRLFAAAEQDVGLDADGAKFLHRVLGRLGLQLAGGRDVGHQGQVHEDRLVRTAFGADLADGFEERQRFDVADGTADLDQADIETFGRRVDAALDLVGHMRDDLHGAAEVVAAAFAPDHFFVDAPGGDRVLAGQAGADETFVMTEIKVGFGAVVGDVDLAMLERRHGARIHVDVGIELHHGDLEAAGLQDGRERRGGDALA